MKALKILKKIGLWTAVSILLIMSFASINTFACIFGFIAIAIILPIDKWQSLLKKFLKTPVKIVSLVVAILAMLVIIGVSNGNTDADNPVDTITPTQTTSTIFIATETTEPTSASSTSAYTTTSETTTVSISTTASQSTTVHTHTFSNATCISPKTCSVCGETTGNANGHTWKAATCTSAKTCSVCGETSGYATGHSYSYGKCSVCGIEDQDYVSEAMVWIPTRGGTKYHSHSSCSNMNGPRHVTISEAISLGFEPCKKCYG